MSGCERFEKLIERYVAGDITSAELEALRQHTAGCQACRGMMEVHAELSQLPDQVVRLPEERFDSMRAAVLGRIRRSGASQSTLDRSTPGRAAERVWSRWAFALTGRPVYALGLAVVFLALGFVLGRMGAGRAAFEEDLLVEEVVRQASQERGLAGYWDSPFIYSNVSFHPRNDGTVTIDFDVSRHVNVTRKLESSLTREILVHAMIDPTAMGARLTAMGVARQTMDEKLKEALVFILLNDPSLPVRLRSLEILRSYASDAGVQDALLVVLAQDPSVQIRLLAVESLAAVHTNPGVIRHALGEPLDENDRAVLHRAVELMGDS